MIYISSSCIKNNSIAQSVEQLAVEGYTNIELSGGTQYYEGFERDLLRLQDKYNLSYLCHNYFPPPKIPFVVNLASLDNEIVMLSMNHLKNAIDLTKVLGANKFGFHAGFLINIPTSELGKQIKKHILFDRYKALKTFVNNFSILKEYAGEVQLFIENNVLANMNYISFNKKNPFFLCDVEGYEELSSSMNFNLLLDVAHLKVSSNTLHLNFENQLNQLFTKSDYIHISDNDGNTDSNKTFSSDSILFKQLSKLNFTNKTITLEVYDGIEALKESYENTNALLVK